MKYNLLELLKLTKKLESILYSKIKIFISEFFNIQKLRLDSFLKETFLRIQKI